MPDVCFPNFIIPYNAIPGKKTLADFQQARLAIAEGVAKSHNTVLTDDEKKRLNAESEYQYKAISVGHELSEKNYRVFYNFAKNYERGHNSARACAPSEASFSPQHSFEVSDAAMQVYSNNVLRKAFENVAEDIK